VHKIYPGIVIRIRLGRFDVGFAFRHLSIPLVDSQRRKLLDKLRHHRMSRCHRVNVALVNCAALLALLPPVERPESVFPKLKKNKFKLKVKVSLCIPSGAQISVSALISVTSLYTTLDTSEKV